MTDSTVPKRRIVVLISGSGTNLQALIDAQNTPALPDVEISLVLSNRKAAFGLTRATQANPPIRTAYLALQPYLKANPSKTRDDYDAEVGKIVLKEKPDLVVLAGWMHVFGDGFLDLAYGVKSVEGERPASSPIPVINLHPALPGEFDGTNAIERAYEAFREGKITRSGAMVHRVVKDVDRGEPLVVREIVFEKDDSLEAFEERLHKVEWEILVKAAKNVLDETNCKLHLSTNPSMLTIVSLAEYNDENREGFKTPCKKCITVYPFLCCRLQQRSVICT